MLLNDCPWASGLGVTLGAKEMPPEFKGTTVVINTVKEQEGGVRLRTMISGQWAKAASRHPCEVVFRDLRLGFTGHGMTVATSAAAELALLLRPC